MFPMTGWGGHGDALVTRRPKGGSQYSLCSVHLLRRKPMTRSVGCADWRSLIVERVQQSLRRASLTRGQYHIQYHKSCHFITSLGSCGDQHRNDEAAKPRCSKAESSSPGPLVCRSIDNSFCLGAFTFFIKVNTLFAEGFRHQWQSPDPQGNRLSNV